MLPELAVKVRSTFTGLRPSTPVVLHGRRLALVRTVWLLFAALGLGFFVAGLPIAYRQLAQTCAGSGCAYLQLSPEEMLQLQNLGLAPAHYAAYHLLLANVSTLAFAGVAAIIYWRRSNEWMALLASLWLVIFGTANEVSLALATSQPQLAPLITFFDELGWTVLLPLFLFTFPDGRFVPRWMLGVYLAYLALGLAGSLIAVAQPQPNNPGPDFAALTWVSAQLAGVIAQVYRYRQVSDPVQHQQTKWFVMGLVSAVGLMGVFLAIQAGSTWPPEGTGFASLADKLAEHTVVTVALTLLPVSLAFAILRSHLWNIDVIIGRALLYTTLAGILVALYVLIVGALGAVFQAQGNLVVSILATGLIAVLFHPLRLRLQAWFNRKLYGQRDEPAALMAGLGQRMEEAVSPLAAVVETITEALKVPYAAIALYTPDGSNLKIVAERGVLPATSLNPRADQTESSAGMETLPLIYQSRPVGTLLVGGRGRAEPFSQTDRQLLENIAYQTALVASVVQLAENLQQARQRLVLAREEERRRLRRDLHDGLGPTVAAQLLKLGSARMLLGHDSAAADTVLADLEKKTEASMAVVRRLIYGLRPPLLDELGLLGALERTAAEYGRANFAGADPDQKAPRVTFVAPDVLPPLPAAVEVAAFRIAAEALTNVVRHAHARSCRIHLAVAGELRLEITDDGIGLPPRRRPGVGLASMRERAAELGGCCTIERVPSGGTRVTVRLPLAN